MAPRSYKNVTQYETSATIVAVMASFVIFVFTLAGLANTTIYDVYTTEGTKHRLSLWNGETCTLDGGCATRRLPPGEWCGERRSLFMAMQAFSVISFLGSCVLILSSIINLLCIRTYFLYIFFIVSAVITWLLLMIQWALVAGIFHSNACLNSSFNEINYQYGASFALFLMAWICLSVLLTYTLVIRTCCD